MSKLIITSNVGHNDRPLMSEIYKAYSYSNRLTDTMKIEKDSEIAVQSLKINKNVLFSLNQFNSNFGLWFGRELETGIDPNGLSRGATGSQAVMNSIVDTKAFEELQTDEVGKRISQALAHTIMHPHYITFVANEIEDIRASIVCAPNVVGGDFQGYNMVFTQNHAISNRLPALADTLAMTGVLENDYNGNHLWTFDPATQRFTSTNPDENRSLGGACAFFHDLPLALNTYNTRAFEVDITNANTQSGFCVGLARNDTWTFNELNGNWKAYAPPYYDNFWTGATHGGQRDRAWSHPNQHYDYVICRIGNNLRIYHSVISSNRQPRNHGSPYNIVMKELRYWEVAGSPLAGAGPYDLAANMNGYTKVAWSIDNTAVEPWVYDPAAMNWIKIIDISAPATTKLYKPKLRGTLQNCLYGKVWVKGNGEYLTIDRRASVDAIDDWNINHKRVDYVRHLIANGTYSKWGRDIEIRQIYDYDPANLVEATYTRANVMNGVLDNFKPILITAPAEAYNEEMTKGANTQYIMGFVGRSLQDQPVVSGMQNEIYTFTSSETPRLTSPKSLFIKLSNFTHQTANGQQGQKASKILAHLPRFDSAGNEVGGLFFEPHERVYVSLDNANDLYINDFDVEICYDNEELAECISGKTIVCFHVRKKLFAEIK